MSTPIMRVELRLEHDLVLARQRARQIAELLAFDPQAQTRIATAVSELARNALRYAGGGRVEFQLDAKPPMFVFRVSDNGPGIKDLDDVLAGRYRSDTGMGLGLVGVRRLMDSFQVETEVGGGTTVAAGKTVPPAFGDVRGDAAARLGAELARLPAESTVEEIQHQNQELMGVLEDLSARQEELTLANRELEDTSRGVLALYTELDDRARELREAGALRDRFLSMASHELRTPLNGILGLSGLLLDGSLPEEHRRDVALIRAAAEELTALVDDLLDLEKIRAGKLDVQLAPVDVAELFSALRGMLHPLVPGGVALSFESPDDLPELVTDGSKLAQILRNLLSNALKFTPQGEVRAVAEVRGEEMLFRVSDTGVGIAPEDLERVFEEFAQVPGEHQAKVKGTGLGLPLCRRLASALGGEIALESELGRGSSFELTLPLGSSPSAAMEPDGISAGVALRGLRALVIDDVELDRHVIRTVLEAAGHEVMEAGTGERGIELATAERPDVVFLDLVMTPLSGQDVLERLRARPDTAALPVIVCSSKSLSPQEEAGFEAAGCAILTKRNRTPTAVAAALAAVTAGPVEVSVHV